MISSRRTAAAFSLLVLAAVSGCASLPATKVAGEDASWVSGPTDLRKMTAVVRVNPPARLKAALEEIAARTDDPDYADFLRMHASGGFGSGFLMVHRSADGVAPFLVTNRHVIAESEEAEVAFGDGTTYKGCEVVYASAKYDLAVLALPDSALRALGAGLKPRTGSVDERLAVIAAGYPGVAGRPSYQVTDGKVSNARFSLPEIGDETLLQHTAAIDPGSSGGPLTDESGALVGVNVMLMRKRSSMFFAVPAAAVAETVAHAHALHAKRRSTSWMTSELEKACTTLSAELGSASTSAERLTSFVSNAAIAERGLESYALVARSPLGHLIRRDFFQDPMSAMRRSVLVRIAARSAVGGGATGACGGVHPGDVDAIADGKPVRVAMKTRNGAMELVWKFEHGAWRVAGGELLEPTPLADEAPAAPKVKPASSKPSAKTAARGSK